MNGFVRLLALSVGATINLDSPLLMRATGVGSETTLSKIVSLVDEAQTSKAPIQAYADAIARIFVPIVLLLALLTFLIWYSLLKSSIVPRTWLSPGQSLTHLQACCF